MATERAKIKAIEAKIEEMLEWYVANNPSPELPTLAVDKKTYRGKVLRWLEPILPLLDNPVLIEEALGDHWTLRFEPMQEAKPTV